MTIRTVLALLLTAFLTTGILFAESNNKVLGLRISSETAPTGSMAQVKVFVTTPQPVAAGTMAFTFDGLVGVSPQIAAATVFGATGDVSGISQVNPLVGFVVRFTSPTAGVGRLQGVPLIEFTLLVDKAWVIGVDLGRTSVSDLQGRTYLLAPDAVQSGGVKVGGTLALENVIPGGGIVSVGSTLQIWGTGFTPTTTVSIEGVSVASTSFVSPKTMSVTLAADNEMTGKHIRVQNQGEQIDYWSWLHFATLIERNSTPANESVFPVFPLNATTSAIWRQSEEVSYVSYLALQNPSSAPVDASVTRPLDGGTSSVTVPSWGTLLAIPASATPDADPNVISSSAPIRILGYRLQYGNVKVDAHAAENRGQQPPLMGSLVNAASLAPGAIVPGEIITIFGVGEGPPNPAGLTLDDSGKVASSLRGTRILFDGVPAPLLYTSASQVNAVVPYEVAGKEVTTVQVEYNGTPAAAWGIPVAPAAPAIFTLDSSGQGQAAVLNQDNSINGASNPAARGTVIQIFATGEGQTSPPGATGSVTQSNPNTPALPVKVTIGGLNAPVMFVGAAPNSVAGLLQVNALVPLRLVPDPTVPLSLIIGDIESQGAATIAVK